MVDVLPKELNRWKLTSASDQELGLHFCGADNLMPAASFIIVISHCLLNDKVN